MDKQEPALGSGADINPHTRTCPAGSLQTRHVPAPAHGRLCRRAYFRLKLGAVLSTRQVAAIGVSNCLYAEPRMSPNNHQRRDYKMMALSTRAKSEVRPHRKGAGSDSDQFTSSS